MQTQMPDKVCPNCKKAVPYWNDHCFACGHVYAPEVMADAPRVCIHCGKIVAKDRQRLCNNCGLPFAPEAGGPSASWGAGVGPAPGQYGSVIPVEELPPVLTRTYRGKPGEVELLRTVDAEALAQRGYYPYSQSYVEGSWSGMAWVLAFLAMILLVGIIILAYMIAAKPAGTLTVLYERRVPQPLTVMTAPIAALPAATPALAASPVATIDAETKVCPECAEVVRAAARICRFCRYEFAPSPTEP